MSDFGITDEEFIEGLANDRQYATHVLCTHHLGWSFQQLQLLEDYAATLTHICDEERVKLKLGKAQAEWDAAGRRYEAIAKSTFGTVVALLIKAGIRAQHAQYLRAVVDLRNEFVHKLHHVVPFPGEFQKFSFPRKEYLRRVFYYGKRFARAQHYLPKILADAGLIIRTSFGEDGWGITNPNLYEHLFQPEQN